MSESVTDSLSFTGERFLPERGGEIWYEHWHRYALARQLAPQRTVLDVACGEGYGAAMLAGRADRVTGVDLSDEAIGHARQRYGHLANLEFIVASCDNLPFADASFDLAISFETIEHIETQQEFIAELLRVLRPGGVLVLSSPNKRLYSDAHDYHNEFHVRELYRHELEDLLLPAFPYIAWLGQKLLFHSAIWPDTRTDAGSTAENPAVDTGYLASSDAGVAAVSGPPVEPMYYIAVCSTQAFSLPPVLNRLSLFSDSDETVYQDYVRQTRRVIELDQLLIDRDEYLSLRTQQMQDRERLIAERDVLLALRNEQLDECARQIAERDALLGLRTGQFEELEHLVSERDAMLALRTEQLEERECLIVERDAILELRNEQLGEHARQIVERDALLVLRTGQMEERERLIVERDELLALRNEQLDERTQQIVERDALLGLRTEQLDERNELIREHGLLLARRSEKIAEQERLILALNQQIVYRASLVWWLKSPLRFMKSVFKATNWNTMPQAIDIIIPVYNAYDDLQRCVDSVRRSTGRQHRLILIDDCSPDSRIADYFETLRVAADPNLSLLRNDVNLGFVGTVNRGMALSQNDVVLLNSDTIVTTGWLDKLCKCADFDRSIGTITPFSNNAEICSFPNFCQDNALPEGLSAEDLNRAIEAAALPVYPDIPTGVGFCMFIRRELLNRIGAFDAETFRLGYGEENDFCMRAAASGWRNVLCDDTFVQHVGSRSFDTKKKALAEENMQRLLAKHPDYMQRVMAFIAADPIKPIRQLAQTFQAFTGANASKPGILHIMHGRAGGTEQHIRSLAHSDGGVFRHYLLVTMDDVWQLKDANSGELLTYQFTRSADQLWSDFLSGLCASFHIRMCHVHHLAGCRLGLLEAFRTLNIPYGFSVHDFYLACPTINLLDDTGIYCGGETAPARCQTCINAQPDFRGIDIVAWRAAHAAFIERAVFVIAPSAWAAAMFSRYFPRDDIQVIPHGVDIGPHRTVSMPPTLSLPKDKHRNIGVLGAIGPVKGARQLERLVARSRERELALRWVVIGYLDRQFQPHQDADTLLTVHGQYLPENMEALLDHYRIDLVVFPSAGPETYCYTLTEGWLAGRPALVPPIGALHERVQTHDAGWIMQDWRSIDAILDDVVSIVAAENSVDFSQKKTNAQAVQVASVNDMANATETIYREILRTQAVGYAAPSPLPQPVLYAALQTALGVAAAEKQRTTSGAQNWLLRAAHLGLRVRYTPLGRLLYRVIPVRWQQILKRRLLA